MKTIILALLLPCFCNAQKNPLALDTSKPHWSFTKPFRKGVTRVVDNSNGKYETLAVIDTFGHLKIYGDTLSVLKAIFKSHNVEIKTDNQ